MLQHRTAVALLLLLLSLVQLHVQGSTNVAKGKAAYASSWYSSTYYPKYAVDGSTRRYFHSKYNDENSWWAVDLGKIMYVSRVYINTGHSKYYLDNFLIGVTNTNPCTMKPFIWGYQLCAAYFKIGGTKPGNHLNLKCPRNIKGRFVVIQLLRRFSYLMLTEVDVYVHSDPGNMAKGKKAWESSSPFGTSLATKACDGSKQNNAVKKQCSVTKLQNDPWWVVDLGSLYAIKHVVLYSRGDCCQNSLQRFVVGVTRVCPTKRKPAIGKFPLCYAYNKPVAMGTKVHITCSSVMLGRYIIIQKPGRHRRLALCEVEVYTY